VEVLRIIMKFVLKDFCNNSEAICVVNMQLQQSEQRQI
jgi:hypothetical protein